MGFHERTLRERLAMLLETNLNLMLHFEICPCSEYLIYDMHIYINNELAIIIYIGLYSYIQYSYRHVHKFYLSTFGGLV